MVESIKASISLALLAVCLGTSACQDPAVIDPALDEPFLYLILNERTTTFFVEPFRVQQAFLLTPGAPSQPPVYRGAESFEMQRLSDGATIAWQAHSAAETASGEVVPRFPGLAWSEANFYVPASPGGAHLGDEGIAPGQRYSLSIRTGGVVLEGIVRVPDSLNARIQDENGRAVVYWPEVGGAAGYWVTVQDGRWYSLQDANRYAVPDEAATGSPIVVRAVDPALWLYLTEPETARAGFEGDGYGVFGAISADTVFVP